MLERFSTKLLVFTGLLGAAGVAWGVFAAGTIGPAHILFLFEGPRSSTVWALPVTLALVLLAIWLANWTVLGSPRRALSAIHAAHFFILPYLFMAGFVGIVASSARWVTEVTLASYILGFVTVALLDAREVRRRHRECPDDRQEPTIKAVVRQFAPLAVVTAAILAGLSALVPSGWHDPLATALAYAANLALVFAWMTGSLASFDFGRTLALAMLAGALTGAWSGWLAAAFAGDARPGRGSYLGLAAGLGVGAVISGLAYGAQIVQFVHLHSLALDHERAFGPAVAIWGICGALVGLLIAAVLHALTGDKSERPGRLMNGMSFAAVPLLLASFWAFNFVREKDAGRHLFAQADRLEGHGYCVMLGCGLQYENPHPRRALVIRLTASGSDRARQRDSYRETIRLCDELLARYPKSAYRSAALYLKFWCCSNNWQPREAVDAWARLQARYPTQRFGFGPSDYTLRDDYTMLGDYESVLSLARERPLSDRRYPPSLGEIRAAEVLGRWNEAAQLCRERTSYLRTQRLRPGWRPRKLFPLERLDIARMEKRIARAEAMKARRAGPLPRTDISGQILIGGKPWKDIAVCVLPAGEIEPDEKVRTVSSVARSGGLLGVTDERGVYRIPCAPSGDYEIIVVLDPKRFPAGSYRARVRGIPFRAAGRAVAAPLAELTAESPAAAPGRSVPREQYPGITPL